MTKIGVFLHSDGRFLQARSHIFIRMYNCVLYIYIFVEFKARQKKVDEVFKKNASQDNVETTSDVSDKDAKLVSSNSPEGNSTNDDELEHNNNVFDNNNYCNDEVTMTE